MNVDECYKKLILLSDCLCGVRTPYGTIADQVALGLLHNTRVQIKDNRDEYFHFMKYINKGVELVEIFIKKDLLETITDKEIKVLPDKFDIVSFGENRIGVVEKGIGSVVLGEI